MRVKDLARYLISEPVTTERTFFLQIKYTGLPSKKQLRWLRTRKPLAYRESTCGYCLEKCHFGFSKFVNNYLEQQRKQNDTYIIQCSDMCVQENIKIISAPCYFKAPENVTDGDRLSLQHTIFFLDTSTSATKTNCMWCIRYDVACMGMTFIYTQEKTPHFSTCIN